MLITTTFGDIDSHAKWKMSPEMLVTITDQTFRLKP
jgi:hypothetical protein